MAEDKPVATSVTKRDVGMRGLWRFTFNKALEVAQAVFEVGDGDPVPKTMVLAHLGRKDGGYSKLLLASPNYYGITNTSKEKFTLTDLGRTLTSSNTDDAVKRKAVVASFFANELFSALIARFAEKTFPADKTVILYLTQSQRLSEDDAKTYWNIVKSNLEDYGLVKELPGGTRMILSKETFDKSFKSVEATQPDNVEEPLISIPDTSPKSEDAKEKEIDISRHSSSLQPEFIFNIKIQIPENATEQVYEAIFKNMGKYLLGNSSD